MARPLRLMEIFVELSDSMTDGFEVIDYWQRFAARCTEALGVPAAGVLLMDGQGDLQAVAASGRPALLLELFALQNDDGPGADCCRSGEARVNIDLTDPATTAPWARYASRAREAGFGVTHAVPLRVRDRIVGALTLLDVGAARLDAEDAALARALADVAAIAVLRQRDLARSEAVNVRLRNALHTRIVIEQAKGILAERWNTGVDHAFHALRDYARTHELRIADLSYAVVDGRLDTTVIPRPRPAPMPDALTYDYDGWPVHHVTADAWARRSWPYRAVHRKPRSDPSEGRL